MVLRFDAADMMAGGGRQESEYVQETAPFRWTVYSLSAELWGTTKWNILSWTGPCNTPGPCNTRLIQPITINFSHSFRYIYKLYTAVIFSVKFESLLNVSIEDIVNSRTHLV